MEEVWKDIKGYEGLYQISNLGKVKSLNYNHCANKEKILKLITKKGGYLQVVLYKDKKKKVKLVHRLVAQAFLSDYSETLEVNHKDENKKNNCVANLEMCTREENCNYGTRNERGAKAKTNGAKSKKIFGVNTKSGKVITFPSLMEAQRNGFVSSNIFKCCTGERKTHKSYKWYYVEDIEDLYFKEED